MSMPISSLPSNIPEVPIFSAFFLLILNLFGIIWSVIIVVQILLWIFKNFIKNPIISRHRARSHCQDFSAINTNKISEEIEKQLSVDNDDLYWCDISIKEEGISTIVLSVIFFGFQYILFIISGGFDVQFFKPIAVFCGLTTIPFLASVFSSVMGIVRNQHWQAIYMLTSAGAVIITPGLFGLSNHILTTPYSDMPFCEAKDGNLFYNVRVRKVKNSDGGTLLTDDVPPQNDSAKVGFYHIYDLQTPADIIRAKRNAEQVPILSISDFVNFYNFSSPLPSHQNAHQLNIISSSSSNPSSIPSIPSHIPSIPSSSSSSTLYSHQIAVSGNPYFQPVTTPAVPVPITVFINYGSQLIGFVKMLPTAVIADLRLEIEADEISVPPNYTFVFLSAPVTSKQETKLTVGECVSIVDSKNVIFIVSHD